MINLLMVMVGMLFAFHGADLLRYADRCSRKRLFVTSLVANCAAVAGIVVGLIIAVLGMVRIWTGGPTP